MEQKEKTLVKENDSAENLKQRLNDIPLVHKPPAVNDANLPYSSELLKQTKSCHSYFYPELGNFFPRYDSKSNKLPIEHDIFNNSEPVPDSDNKSEESDVSSRILQIPQNQWLIGGTLGSRNSLLVFKASALAGASQETIKSKPAYKLHITYKVLQAETKLLSKLLDCHGVTEVVNDSTDFNILWTGNHPKPGVFRALTTYQRINHFPRSYELTRKDRLYKNIERMQHAKGIRNFDFIPQTFIMPSDFKDLCSVHYRIRGPWIVKPVASSRGRGIFIVETPYQVPLDEPVVVAKYICNPLLVDGHKCDLRLYVAVTSYDPLLIYIYEEGLVRFATVKYDTSHKQLWNPCMHLCNYSINKYHSDYIKSDDPCAENVGHKWTLSALLRHLKSLGKDTVQLMSQIEDIIVKSIITSANSIISACQMFVPNQSNCFELFGFDILLDENLKAWLLEVNLSPSLGCDSPLDVRLKSAMLADLLTLVGVPAVDPILKPVNSTIPSKANSLLKMKLGSCRRVHSADGLSQSVRKMQSMTQPNGRLTNSTFCLSPDENRLIKLAKAQFDRRGGWVRIFPTADSWYKYSQYLDPVSGIPSSCLPQPTACQLVIQHNYNYLLHTQLFSEAHKLNLPKTGTSSKVTPNTPPTTNSTAGTRHTRYERHLDRGHKSSSLEVKHSVPKNSPEDYKLQVCQMLKNGKILTQGEVRRIFSQYLQCILRRLSTYCKTENESHVQVVLNFLQKASAYLRTPYIVKVPSSKLAGKDRAALVAKQLNDFLYLYNRETELYSDTVDRLNSVPFKLFSQFLQTARESDLEEVLTIQTLRALPQRVNVNTNCGFQGLLKCLPNTLNTPKSASMDRTKKTALKVAKPS